MKKRDGGALLARRWRRRACSCRRRKHLACMRLAQPIHVTVRRDDA